MAVCLTRRAELGEEPPFLPSSLDGYNPLIWGSSPHIHRLWPCPMSFLGEIPDMPRKRSRQSISLRSTHCEQEATSRNQRNISTGEKGRFPSSQNELPQEVVSFLCLEGLKGEKGLSCRSSDMRSYEFPSSNTLSLKMKLGPALEDHSPLLFSQQLALF